MVGLDKPNIGLFSEEILEDVKSMKEKILAVELTNQLRKSATVGW
jgi:type I restriction enzyme R subunit